MANSYNIKKPETIYKPTSYSDAVGAYASDIAKAQAAYEQALAAKPAAYQSQYIDRMNNIADRLGSRAFNYDVNSDALFQQLKAIYNEQGRLAMADTQGNAAALTGGYGNSYGVTASQQAYQQTQNQLYDRIPELYQLALARYQQEGSDLKDQYSLLADQESTAYGKYRDQMTDYENERSFRDAALRNLQSMNQSVWSQDESNKSNAYNQAMENYRWAEQMAENARQFDAQMAYKGTSGGSGSGSSSGSSGKSTTTKSTYSDGSTPLNTGGDKVTKEVLREINNKVASGVYSYSKISDVIAQKYNNFDLTEAEARWLLDYYKNQNAKTIIAMGVK